MRDPKAQTGPEGTTPVEQVALTRGWQLYRRHLSGTEGLREFDLAGRTWELCDSVFSPAYTPITELLTSWIPYPVGGSFLEVGSGTGVTAVTAALTGCRPVTAVDISAAAVENTRRNAARHGVDDRVEAVRSDLFSALPRGRRYDVIYWNSSFVEVPSQFVCTDLQRAFFDPGYEAHRRYVHEGRHLLEDGGRLLLGFSSIGSWPQLRSICDESGVDIQLLRSEHRRIDDTDLTFQLLELRPGGSAS
jgi:release factor glutamine methyltransferase